MKKTLKVIVSIHLGGKEIELGELVQDGKLIHFKYFSDFIERGLEISPFKLKLSKEIQTAPLIPFEGLFGVFADSQPDGWGRFLVDRTLIAKGYSLPDITSLDRLSYIGLNGMGALMYKPCYEEPNSEEFHIELDNLAHSMNKVLEGTSDELIEELFQLGGSSGGARPKILVAYNTVTEHLIHGLENLPEGYEHWIIKFPSSSDRRDIASIEFAYYKMALDAGIEMNESKLFAGKSGSVYFGTKRFDRQGADRLHLHSAAGLMHDNFRLSTMDYGHLMDCAFKLEQNVSAYQKILRLAAFNLFMYNRDDHSKNFSFLMDNNGSWKVAPAYDLTFSMSAHGMHSTLIAGESKNPQTKHLMDLVNYFKIKNGKEIINSVKNVTNEWKKYGKENNVNDDSLLLISKTIQKIQ